MTTLNDAREGLLEIIRLKKDFDDSVSGHFIVSTLHKFQDACHIFVEQHAAQVAEALKGEAVYQRMAQIAVYGDVWFDISRETYEATKGAGGEPDAYLHTIIDSTDGEEDLALSFSPDSFPFDSLEQYKSLKVEPLFTRPPVAGLAECVCTCPSGDGSLRWPCPKHPPMIATEEMIDSACEAYADMYDVEYIDGGNRDNRRACIKAALEAAYREFLGKV
jgi:hypothetical protein